MKKKFSTFFATMAFLWCAVFAVNAQSSNINLNKDQLGNLYQIAVGDDVSNQILALDDDGTIITTSASNLASGLTLAHTLWCVEISAEDQGQNVVYSFLNKATGQYLSITMQDFGGTGTPGASSSNPFDTVLGDGETLAGGEISRWKFSDDYDNKPLLKGQPMYAFYNKSYSIGIHIGIDGKVYFVKQASTADIASDNQPGVGTTYTNLALQTAASVQYLSEEQFNEVLGTQKDDEGVRLVFDKSLTVNPFADVKVFADEAAVYNSYDGNTYEEFLYIRNEEGEYLMVDTSYYNQPNQNRYLKYKWVNLTDTAKKYNYATVVGYLNSGRELYRGHYMFRFEYEPTPNNLLIQVAGIVYADLKNDNAYVFWPQTSSNLATYINYTVGGTTNNYQPLPYIWSQSYSNGDSELTVNSIDATNNYQNVTIGFAGFDGCTVSENKTSLDEDLYVIRNEEGKYLAVPLSQEVYNNVTGSRRAEWITLDRNKDPWRMPAFQWVVEKTQSASELVSTSPLKITNREYGDIVLENGRIQLYKDDSTKIVGVNITSANFIEDPANVKADPYVGYRMLDKDSLKVTGYKFRYLHEYNDEKYLGIGGLESDSVLYADTKSQFALDTVPVGYLPLSYTTPYANSSERYEVQTYGKTPMGSDSKPKKGWAELKRRSYFITVKGTAEPTYVVKDAEDRYAVSSKINYYPNSTTIDFFYGENVPVRFYLKENNYKDGRDYYVLIDQSTDDRNYNSATFTSRKAAIDDNTVIAKSYALTENRTSAFAIEIDDTPLYRRFANDPAEGAYANGDGPDTMRFYEKYRHEYLQMEANPNFMEAGIDFLGINTKSEAKNGLAFQVDSAWIGRGLGYIKPQYLISIDRNDQPAVAPIECPEEFHGNAPDGTPYDKWTCPHATKGTPGFNRGRYLINFEFQGYGAAPGSTDKEIAENKYMWKKFYRAGFVDAVHIGDSLYILRDEFAGITNAHIDTAKIKAAEAAWRKADKNVDRSKLSYYIIDLSDDKHTFATWSMRYVEPENVATNNAFLMESMSWNNGNERNWIAPTYGAWLKMQNGCLVLSDRGESEFRKETAGDDALIFNVEYVEGDELATDDEVIAENSVVVIAGQGTVTVKNAAGKKVAISNILGQTVANTVITSDNATIAVPAGVAVVAVEGEAAVKAIVK